jgi:hypothetical protein
VPPKNPHPDSGGVGVRVGVASGVTVHVQPRPPHAEFTTVGVGVGVDLPSVGARVFVGERVGVAVVGPSCVAAFVGLAVGVLVAVDVGVIV